MNEFWDIRNGLTGRLSTEMSFPSRETAQRQIDFWIERGRRGGRPDVPMWKLLGMVPVRRFGPRPEDDRTVSTRQFDREVEVGAQLSPANLAYLDRLASLTLEQLALMVLRLERQLTSPPEGWFTFGTHSGIIGEARLGKRELEFWGISHDGLPIWERPVG